MAVKIGQITNSDVYDGAESLVGRFKDFQLPDVESTEVKHETLGQIAVLMLPGRPLKELKGKGTFDFFDVDRLPGFYIPNRFLTYAVHSYVDVFNETGVDLAKSFRLVTNVTMSIRKVGGKPFKLGDAFEGDFEYACTRLAQTVAGQKPILEIDVLNQIHRVNGVDVWSKY